MGTPSVLPLRVKPHSPFCRYATSSPGRGKSALKGTADPLRRSRARFPLLSPAVTSSPGAGEVFPRRESQGLRLVAKVLGIVGKFAAAPKGAPLGELAANVVSRLRGFYP